MLRRRFILALSGSALLAGFGLSARSVWAQAPGAAVPEAGDFVARLFERALADINTPNISPDERARRFRALLNQSFDVPWIAQFVIGRYRRLATEEQMAEYQKLFEDLIVQIYSSRFNDFSQAQLRVLGTRAGSEGDVFVFAEGILPNQPPIKVDCRIRRNSPNFKIVDLLFENVSMLVTQRDEFSAVIQRGGGKVEALLQILREKTGAKPK
ncbi:MAG: ABC transporter substrate-binding protein [Rhodospirillales bacterium]|nr:ABC transporter substrate-binding protein [Rhodospirillales bacterium]